MAELNLRAYLELCRVGNLPTVWTNAVAAVVLSRGRLLCTETVGAMASLSLVYVAGMCLNDIVDVTEDRVRKPGRPLPSGRVSRPRAIMLTVVLFVAALAILHAAAGLKAFLWGIVLCAFVILYDWLHRRHPATVLLMAGCRALVFAVAASAGSGALTMALVIGAAAQFLYVVALSVISRREKTLSRKPLVSVPWLLAGIALVDGLLLAVLVHPVWMALGLAGALATRVAQVWVPGD